MPERILILGAGRVGLSLGLALPEAGYEVVGIWNRSAAGRDRARELLETQVFHQSSTLNLTNSTSF